MQCDLLFELADESGCKPLNLQTNAMCVILVVTSPKFGYHSCPTQAVSLICSHSRLLLFKHYIAAFCKEKIIEEFSLIILSLVYNIRLSLNLQSLLKLIAIENYL